MCLYQLLISVQDISRIFAQQPFKGPLPARYLIPSPTTTLRPPKLRYGWRLGHDKLMDIAHKHFKEAVQYRFAPATENLDVDVDLSTSIIQHDLVILVTTQFFCNSSPRLKCTSFPLFGRDKEYENIWRICQRKSAEFVAIATTLATRLSTRTTDL